MTQQQLVIRFIKDTGSITALQAAVELGITQLSARIGELEQLGYEFEREAIKSRNRYGETIRYYKYTIKKEA